MKYKIKIIFIMLFILPLGCCNSLVWANGNQQAASSTKPSLQNNAQMGGVSAQDINQVLESNPQLLKNLAQAVQTSDSDQAAEQQTTSSTRQASAQQPSDTQTSQTQSTATQSQADSDAQSKQQAAKKINSGAFNSVKQQAFPLSPKQIQILHDMYDDTQRAEATDPFEKSPQPTSSSLFVNLSPGSTPPVIRLTRGFVSSLVFIDSTGAPWPIEAYSLGNPSAFNIVWNKEDNTLMIQANSTYTYGNLAVVLSKLNTPVMLTLVPGQKMVDYRVDLRIQGLGPNAKPGIKGIGLPDSADPVLLGVLDGVAPLKAKRLEVPNNVAEAWLLGNKMYVRTRFNVLSPAWLAKMSSADGMNAYELLKTPTLLLSRHGKPVPINLQGF